MTPDVIVSIEKSVIGGILLQRDALIGLTLDPEDFYSERSKHVWRAIRDLEAKNHPIDVETIMVELVARGVDGAIGGYAYLGECALNVPTPDNVAYYAQQIRDDSVRRRVIMALSAVLERAARNESTGAETLSDALGSLSNIDVADPHKASTIGSIASKRLTELEHLANERAHGRAVLTGYPTGIAKLDMVTGGFRRGVVTLIAGRPAMGKSAAAMGLTEANVHAGHGVHVFSLEDTREMYIDRAISRGSGVPSSRIRSVDFGGNDTQAITNAAMRLIMTRGWIVDDRSGLDAEEVVRSARRHARENKTKVIVVDYIQLLRWPKHAKSQHDALTMSITALADYAKHDDVAVVALSQLSRKVEERTDKRPQLADLRESGSLEERAKCVIALYRGAYYHDKPMKGVDYDENDQPPAYEDFAKQVQCIVLKNSSGPPGAITAQWSGPLTRIW